MNTPEPGSPEYMRLQMEAVDRDLTEHGVDYFLTPANGGAGGEENHRMSDQNVRPDVSPMSVDGRRLTWREAYEHERERSQHYQQFAAVLSDLDRCQHGRHEGDACTLRDGCGGPSKGNPHAQAGQVIGYGIGGVYAEIVMPPRDKRYSEPTAWYRRANR